MTPCPVQGPATVCSSVYPDTVCPAVCLAACLGDRLSSSIWGMGGKVLGKALVAESYNSLIVNSP